VAYSEEKNTMDTSSQDEPQKLALCIKFILLKNLLNKFQKDPLQKGLPRKENNDFASCSLPMLSRIKLSVRYEHPSS
jgi:hypothetical protein